jgi:hypothetical protein
MVRQAQIYLTTATSTALLLTASVAVFVVFAVTSSLRNFPIPGLSGLSVPGLTGSNKHVAATPSDPSSTRSRNVKHASHGGVSAARLPTDTRSAAAGPARPEPSSGASSLRLHGSSIGAAGPAGLAPVSVPSGTGSSIPASEPSTQPSAQKSSTLADPVAAPSAKHTSVSDPHLSGKGGVGGKSGKSSVGGKSSESSVPSDDAIDPAPKAHGAGHDKHALSSTTLAAP